MNKIMCLGSTRALYLHKYPTISSCRAQNPPPGAGEWLEFFLAKVQSRENQPIGAIGDILRPKITMNVTQHTTLKPT